MITNLLAFSYIVLPLSAWALSQLQKAAPVCQGVIRETADYIAVSVNYAVEEF